MLFSVIELGHSVNVLFADTFVMIETRILNLLQQHLDDYLRTEPNLPLYNACECTQTSCEV